MKFINILKIRSKEIVFAFGFSIIKLLGSNIIFFILKIFNKVLFYKNTDLIYIFRRKGNQGIISNILFVINALKYLDKFKIPLYVDLKFYQNDLYHKEKKHNIWEDYFLQPSGTKALKIKKKKLLNFPKFHLDLGEQWDVYNLKKLIDYQATAEKYIKLNDKTRLFVNKKISEIINPGDKILGINVRHSYIFLKNDTSNPKQPDITLLLDDIKKIINNNPINKILIVSENINLISKIKKIYGKMVIFIKRPRINIGASSQNILNLKNFPFPKDKLKKLMEVADFGRKDEIVIKNREYISEIYALAKCEHLIAGVCSGTIFSLLLNKGKYKTVKLYNLGYY